MNPSEHSGTEPRHVNGNGHHPGELARPKTSNGAPPASASSDDGNDIFALVTDRLSGRWIPAVVLGLALGAALAVLGYQASTVQYDAVGIIQVSPKINPLMRDTPETSLTPHYAQQIETEARMVTSNPRILDRALHHLDLTETPWKDVPEAMKAIHANLDAQTERNTELIYVTYRSESASLSQHVVNAVLKAYDEIRGSVERDDVRRKMNELRAERAKFNDQWRRTNDEILQFIASTGYAVDDFRGLITTREQLIQDANAEIRNAEHALQVLTQRASAGAELQQERESLVSDRELEDFDEELAQIGQSVRAARLVFANAQERLKPEHDAYIAAQNRLDMLERLYRQRSNEVLDHYVASGQLTGTTVNSPDDLHLRIEQLNQEVEEHRAAAQQMVKWQATLSSMRAQLTQIEQWQMEIDHRIRGLEIEADQISAGRIQVAAYAEYPLRPAQDRRRALAAVGGMGGFGMGFAIFFLLGTVDRRVYAARQLTGSAGGTTGRVRESAQRLLGVLPALPQPAADVEAASVAAHCVHQIRNHIEGTRPTDGPMVLAVSSPYQGDGKTSLIMALGASYAAIGCRVLLVDCDLVGRNLTTHSMMSGQPGLREALRHAATPADTPAINDYCVSAAGPNLDVLPVGHDETFGPEMIRRQTLDSVFDRLRNLYDVILVDTGPLFGSIETLPASAAADGVILVMQRGRRYARLKECIDEIEAIGGEYLGLVLNHARFADCDRYVSKSRISSVLNAHELSESSNGSAKVKRSRDRTAGPRASRNALLRAMQVTSRSNS